MAMEITIPSLGESIKKGMLSTWLKSDGEQVTEGDALFELETEKSMIEFPSPASGVLTIEVAAGTEVDIGQRVATVDSTGAVKPASASTPEAAKTQHTVIEPTMSPSVRRIVTNEGLAPENITASGREGRITKEDVLRAVQAKVDLSKKAVAPPPAISAPPVASVSMEDRAPGGRLCDRVPMSMIRKLTAERLVRAKHDTAYTTTFNEVDMTEVMAIRSKFRDEFEKVHGIRVGFMSFFVKAACQALKQYDLINSMIEGDDLLMQRFYDIGIAISVESGLLVPVIRDADSLSFADIEISIADLANRARIKRLHPSELEGGTFTITNGGVFGSMLSVPIPAHPQTAILGMHTIRKRAVVVDDEIVIRPVMYVALTYDHRVVDGRDAVGFLMRIKEYIETPGKLLLQL
jgi:2-oxoglutarate dehydrogenase E2 component (dihydrolipoamide succinyltransferase)